MVVNLGVKFAKTISEKVFHNVEALIILPSIVLPIRLVRKGLGRMMGKWV